MTDTEFAEQLVGGLEDTQDTDSTMNPSTDGDNQESHQDESTPDESRPSENQDNEDNNKEEDNPKENFGKRAEKRIRDLSGENRRLYQQVQELKAQANEIPATPEWNDEVTPDEILEATDNRTAKRLTMDQANAIESNLAQQWFGDVQEAVETIPELNPDSPEYDPSLDNLIENIIIGPDGLPRLDLSPAEIISSVIDVRKTVEEKVQSEQRQKKYLAEAPLSASVKTDTPKPEFDWNNLPKDTGELMELVKQGKIPL
jgi:hypothetical protein